MLKFNNTQKAPFPAELDDLVLHFRYRDGWYFRLNHQERGQGCEGLTLIISLKTEDSYHPEKMITVQHFFPVPPAAYDRRSWRRWLFDRIGDVETHERMEFFVENGERPYAPSHGPGNDPYMVREVGTLTDQQTLSSGALAGSASAAVPAR